MKTYWHQRENGMGQSWEPGALMCSQNLFCGWLLLTVVCASLPLLFLKMRPFTTTKLVHKDFFLEYLILFLRLLFLIQIFMKFLYLPDTFPQLGSALCCCRLINSSSVKLEPMKGLLPFTCQSSVNCRLLHCYPRSRMELQYLWAGSSTEWSRLVYIIVRDLNIWNVTCVTLHWSELAQSFTIFSETAAW